MLQCQESAGPLSGGVDAGPVDDRVRPGEVDELKDAQLSGDLPRWLVSDFMPSLSTTTISSGWMSRSNRAPTASSAQLSEVNTTDPFFSVPMHSGRKP